MLGRVALVILDSDIDEIEEISSAAVFMHEIGNLLAQIWTVDGDMTEPQAAVVHVLRHELSERADGTWTMKYRFAESNLDVLNDQQWEYVCAIADRIDNPAARSIVEDVLWHERIGDEPFNHAKNAIDAYSSICKTADRHPSSLVYAVRRLAHLTLSTSRPTDQPAEIIERLIDKLLDAPPPDCDLDAVGDLSQLAEAWASLKQPPVSHADPITKLEASTDDPHTLRSLAETRHKYSDNPSADDFTKAIDAFLARGDLGDSVHKSSFYGIALQLALRAQHPKADSIRTAMQQLDPYADVEPHLTESDFSQAEVDIVARQIVESDGARAALMRLAEQLMPLGESAKPPFNGGIIDHIRTYISGPHGSTIRVLTQGGGTIGANKRAKTEIIWKYLVPSLQRIFDHYQPTKTDMLRIFEQCEHVSPAAADTLAEGMMLFGEGRYEPSASTILPRLEQTLRNVAVAANVKITKDPIGRKRGGVIGFGDVLTRLEETDHASFPADLARRLRFFLTDDLGFNLRNDVLHALYSLDNTPVKDWQATVIIGCLIAVISTLGPDSETESTPRNGNSSKVD